MTQRLTAAKTRGARLLALRTIMNGEGIPTEKRIGQWLLGEVELDENETAKIDEELEGREYRRERLFPHLAASTENA